MNTGTQFSLMVAELDDDGHPYVAVVQRVDSTYERALQALTVMRATLFRRTDRPDEVTEIADDRFELLDSEGRPYRRYLVKKV